MKHLKPSLVMIVVVAGIITFLYRPVEGVIFFVFIAVIIWLIVLYSFLYKHFNDK